jgi:uncharacterized membrane protein SpoIIM required for sporulation
MNVLEHGIPTFVAVVILAIAGFVLDWRVRVERRRRASQHESTD